MKRKTKKMLIALAATATLTFAAVAGGCSFSVSEWIEQATCNHVWNDGEVTKVATCTELGEKTFTCTDCGKIETEEIEKIPHSEVTLPAIAATCTDTGLTDGVGCAICGTEIVAQTVIPAIGHKTVRGEGVEATCLSAGLTKGLHCEYCGEVFEEQEVVPALGHNVVAVSGYEATCERNGLTDGYMCDRCGEIIEEQEEILAFGHDYVNNICVTCGAVHPDYATVAYATEGAYVDEELTHAELMAGNVYFSPFTQSQCTIGLGNLGDSSYDEAYFLLVYRISDDTFYLEKPDHTTVYDITVSIEYLLTDDGICIMPVEGDFISYTDDNDNVVRYEITDETCCFAGAAYEQGYYEENADFYRRKLKMTVTYGNKFDEANAEKPVRLTALPYEIYIPEGVTLTAKDGYMFMLGVLDETGVSWAFTSWYESYTPKGGKTYGIVLKKTDGTSFDLATDGLYVSDYIESSDTSIFVMGTTTLVHVLTKEVSYDSGFIYSPTTWCYVLGYDIQCTECGEIIEVYRDEYGHSWVSDEYGGQCCDMCGTVIENYNP